MTTPRQDSDTARPAEATAIPEDQVAPQQPQDQDQARGPGAGVDPSAQQFSPPPNRPEPTSRPAAPVDAPVDETAAGPDHAEVPPAASADTGLDNSLFAEQDLSELRARWNDVQAAFVDDPRDCVQKADGLVSAAVEQLTTSFSETRSRLEDQWSRGEEASTEDLRIALRRYREFFERLLAV